MPTTRTQALSCILGGLVLAAMEIALIHMDHQLDQALPRLDGPALFPALNLRVFGCLVAFLLGWAFFLLPSPIGSDRILTFAALRSLMVGLITAALVFQFLYFFSRFPAVSDVSLSATLRPWTRILPAAVGMSAVATWFSFFGFAQHAYDAKDEAALQAVIRRR
jgi:hypothetical protein